MAVTNGTVAITDGHRDYDVEVVLSDLLPRPIDAGVGVLLRPAFHAETLLVFEPSADAPDAATLTLAAYATSLWYFVAELGERVPTAKERLLEKHRGIKPPPPEIQTIRETALMPHSGAATLEELLATFRQARSEDGDRIGADGISVLGFHITQDDESRFESWSPSPESRSHRFVQLLYDLAEHHLRSPEVERCLEDLHGYLSLGFPWKVVSTSPYIVRIFGSLSSSHLPELRHALEQLPHEPVILDLSGLAGMGTALHPVWRSWLEGRTNISWIVGERGAFHLDCIGVPSEKRLSQVP
jgi:hypothetical protein